MGDHGHGHPNLAHHFDSLDQQFHAGKLGMWLFLATEVLLFAGLFCAYTVYRALHPEVFEHASLFLDRPLGALNTTVLLASSFTAAMAVRSAQLRNKQMTTLMLALTIAGGAGFMVIKYIEYSHKFHDHLLPGAYFDPRHERELPEEVRQAAEEQAKEAAAESPQPRRIVDAPANYAPVVPGAELAKSTQVPRPATRVEAGAAPEEIPGLPEIDPQKVRNVHIFFGIYFCMTGLHGIHVLIGMAVLAWVLLRNLRGDFDKGYYLPVDLAALYWHLVDLIWIYLFPLLYLIA